ncbi:hypothetical protein ACSBR2_037249 [Camellia fascicularis]
MTKAGMLSMLPLGYALELVKKAKAQVSEEYFRSVADLMVIKGRPLYKRIRTISFQIRLGQGLIRDIRGGEDGIVVPIYLPESVMDRFEQELKKMIQEPVAHPPNHKPISML